VSSCPFKRVPSLHRRRVRHAAPAACSTARDSSVRPCHPPFRPSQGGINSLYVAAHNGHVDIAQLLLDNGASVDAASPVGEIRVGEIREMTAVSYMDTFPSFPPIPNDSPIAVSLCKNSTETCV
jgi:hypothetical protein